MSDSNHAPVSHLFVVRDAEAELLDACRAGDRRALTSLLRRHRRAIERACRRLSGPDAYEDVLQDAYLTILRSVASFRGDSSFTTWAFAICRSCAARWYERQRRSLSRVSSSDETSVEAADASRPDHVEVGQVIELALVRLSPLDREVLMMRDGEGMSAIEVAASTGLTVSAVKTRLHRARVAARARLTELDTFPQAA